MINKSTNINNPDITSLVNTTKFSINNSIINIKTKNTSYKIKIHREIIFAAIKNRELKTKYQTNTDIKCLALFYLLKNVSQTSIIKDYSKNLQSILTYTGLTQGTFYTHLNKLVNCGLITKNSKNLVLSDFKTLFSMYGVEEGATPITINYDPNTHKFVHLLEFATIADNIYRQKLVIKKKLQKSPYTLEILERYAKQQTTARTLATAQKHAFVNGSEELNTLFFINPNVTITWKRLLKEFNFKSYKSVSYLKRKLQKNNIVTIEKNGFLTSKVGARTKVFNEETNRMVNTCRYNQKLHKTQKQFADNWILAPKLYGFSMYYKN